MGPAVDLTECCMLSGCKQKAFFTAPGMLSCSTPGVVRTVLLLLDKHQHVLVSPKQVHDSGLGDSCTYPVSCRQGNTLTQPMVLTEQDPQLQKLIHLVGMSNTI